LLYFILRNHQLDITNQSLAKKPFSPCQQSLILSRLREFFMAFADFLSFFENVHQFLFADFPSFFQTVHHFLAAAFSTFTVLNIQLSHFFAVDTFLNLFALLSIYFSVLVATNNEQE